MLSYFCCQPGRLSSMAAVSPATPPPRIATRLRAALRTGSANRSLPEDRAGLPEEVKAQPEREARHGRLGDAPLPRDRLSLEPRDGHAVVVGEQPAGMEVQDLHVDVDECLVARGGRHVRVAELLEQEHRRPLFDEVAEEQ